jgi:hypothetical protein
VSKFDPSSPDYDRKLGEQLAEAHAYFDQLEEEGWDMAERGELPPEPPAGWWSPASAQTMPVGSLVRFLKDVQTTGGAAWQAGEYARVVEHRLMPMGAVSLHLRGSERRRMITMIDDGSIEPATGE